MDNVKFLIEKMLIIDQCCPILPCNFRRFEVHHGEFTEGADKNSHSDTPIVNVLNFSPNITSQQYCLPLLISHSNVVVDRGLVNLAEVKSLQLKKARV